MNVITITTTTRDVRVPRQKRCVGPDSNIVHGLQWGGHAHSTSARGRAWNLCISGHLTGQKGKYGQQVRLYGSGMKLTRRRLTGHGAALSLFRGEWCTRIGALTLLSGYTSIFTTSDYVRQFTTLAATRQVLKYNTPYIKHFKPCPFYSLAIFCSALCRVPR